ncbi:MAG TPA: proprotein convertase P-domain-containing protein, partial [Phycisphaerales bacterium]|nr:proprotein convertase P-domain-containing protein [Phycisphaerales bacterium]
MKRFVLSFALLGALATSASGQTFSSGGTIIIPNAGAANPYPATINVAGGPAAITSISVTLNNLRHTYIGDIDVLLVGPGGQTVVLFSDVGNGVNFQGETLTFTSALGAPSAVQNPFTGGTFAPTNVGAGDAFPAPAPAGPHGAGFGAFIGANANGVWSLYILDDVGGDSGTVSGWSITFNQATPIEPTSNLITYQGKLTNGAVPVNGNVDLQFGFWRTAFASGPGELVLAPPALTNVPVSDGLFTVRLNPGNAFFDNRELWLEIAVRNPAGVGGFVTLNGRQRITPAPSATWASSADEANTAARADSATHAFTADTLLSPDNTPVVRTANNGVVGIARPPTTIGNGTFVVEGVQGNAANIYGGMHVNTPHADAWPFVGLATADVFRAWMYYNPATTSMIFNNEGNQMWVKNNGVTVNTPTL